MKVAHLLRKYNPLEWGGTETAIYQLLDGLRGHGVESVVFCPKINEEPGHDPLAASGHTVKRFRAFLPVWGIGEAQRRQLIAVGGNLMSLSALWLLGREPKLSVIHAHTLGRLGGIARTVACRRKVPLVVTIHGGLLDLPAKTKEELAAPLKEGWEWGRFFGLLVGSHKVLADADAIIALNLKEGQLLQQKFPRKRVLVMPHGIPMSAYEVDHRASAYAAFPAMQHRTVLLVLGRIDPVKNQGWLIEQVPAIRNAHPSVLVVFVGAATDREYSEGLRRRTSDLGVGDQVLLTGGLPPRDPKLIGLLQTATVLIVPSVSETFGLVLLEAWSAGAPVIASRTSGALQLVKEGENGCLYSSIFASCSSIIFP